MADKPISNLPQVGSISDSAMFVLEQGGAAYHATAKQIKNMVPSSGGGSGEGGTGDLTGAVRYDVPQELLETEKTQARTNMDVPSNLALELVVHNVQILRQDVDALENRLTGLDVSNLTEDFNGGSVTYTYEDGSTVTYTQGIDAEGNATLTSGDHVITLKGLI